MDCNWLILGHAALTKIKCIPIGLQYSTLSKHGGKWRDRRREKHRQVLPVFFFVNEHNNTITKPQAKKQRFLKLSQKFPEEKQQLVEEKDADNMRKVLLFVNHSFSGFEN